MVYQQEMELVLAVAETDILEMVLAVEEETVLPLLNGTSRHNYV
jgi:hypothetical protein